MFTAVKYVFTFANQPINFRKKIARRRRKICGWFYKKTGLFAFKGEKEEATCLGDSGGPLFLDDKYSGVSHLIGIISVGCDCVKIPGKLRLPTITTYVYSVMDWIKKLDKGVNEIIKCKKKRN